MMDVRHTRDERRHESQKKAEPVERCQRVDQAGLVPFSVHGHILAQRALGESQSL